MEYERCTQCGEEATADSDFCPHCGSLFENGRGVRCFFHDGHDATGVCIVCRRPVCTRSGVRKNSRWLCNDHRKVLIEQDWALIFQSPDINEAELVKSALESFGYRVVARNFGPNTSVWEGGGDSYLSRHTLNRLAKVFVPVPDYERARLDLNQWLSHPATTS